MPPLPIPRNIHTHPLSLSLSLPCALIKQARQQRVSTRVRRTKARGCKKSRTERVHKSVGEHRYTHTHMRAYIYEDARSS